jgi:hypothetical protein
MEALRSSKSVEEPIFFRTVLFMMTMMTTHSLFDLVVEILNRGFCIGVNFGRSFSFS